MNITQFLPEISWTRCAAGVVHGYCVTKALDRIDRDLGQLRAAIFIGAEHISQDFSARTYSHGLHGGDPQEMLQPAIRTLNQVDTPNARALAESLNPDRARPLLGCCSKSEAASRLQKIRELAPGQIFSIATWKQHAVIISAQRKGNGRLTVRIHNGGLGIEKFHPSLALDGKTLYQTALEFDEVEEADCLAFVEELCRLHDFLKGASSDQFISSIYESANRILKGIKLGFNPDLRYWPPHQTGGSCSGYSIYCFVKAFLSEGEFDQFMRIFTQKMGDRLEEGARSWRFWEWTEYHAQTIKELRIRHLQLEKGNAPFPQLPPYRPSLFSRAVEKGVIFMQKARHSETGILGALLPDTFSQRSKSAKLNALRISTALLSHPSLIPLIHPFFNDLQEELLFDGSLQVRKEDLNLICAELQKLPLPAREKNEWVARFRREAETGTSEMLINAREDHLFARSAVLAQLLSLVGTQGEGKISQPGAKQIAAAFARYREGKMNACFEEMRKAYAILGKEKISQKELIGCIQALVPLADYAQDTLTPAVSSAGTQDEIEFFLANALLYKKLRSRLPVSNFVDRTLAAHLLPHPTWQADAERYGSYGLARYFSRGPWKHDLFRQEKAHADSQARLRQTLLNLASQQAPG